MPLRSTLARIPGLRPLAQRWGFAAPAVGYDDRPATPEVRADLTGLRRANRFSRKPAVDPESPVVVTMTTHGRRLRRVHVAIESIARGTTRPARLMLWLDDPAVRIPRSLRRLERRGVEVLRAEPGNKVHTKYYPYVASIESHSLPLVTSDDDIIYPPTWLEDLLRAAAAAPDVIHCHRAHHLEFVGDEIAPYLRWTACTTTEASFRNFGTSVSGQWLPPQLLDRLREEGTRFRDVAPFADDIWLHRVAVAAGIPTAQLTTHPQHFPFVPRTQSTGLYFHNAEGDGNDAQVAATYDEHDRAALRDAR